MTVWTDIPTMLQQQQFISGTWCAPPPPQSPCAPSSQSPIVEVGNRRNTRKPSFLTETVGCYKIITQLSILLQMWEGFLVDIRTLLNNPYNT